MIDVGEKPVSRRVCRAEGRLLAREETLIRIERGELPKGNALALAEAAGFAAIKKTPELLPLCHPLPIDAARFRFEFLPGALRVECEVITHAKTGVEMEALSGVSAFLLCIYDLVKGIDPELELGEIRLMEKTGGKSGHWVHPRNSNRTSKSEAAPLLSLARAAVITLSDRASRGESEDRSGPALASRLQAVGVREVHRELLPDEPELLLTALKALISEKIPLIVTTGGTGTAPRDRTPETLRRLEGRLIPGLGELMRSTGSRSTLYAYLSRSEGLLVDETLILALPGSVKGATESLDAVLPLLEHLLRISAGGNHG
jgi:molybdenum cofactor biosynthesis protein MoaC